MSDEKRMNLLRNFGIFAHIDAGKTTITERILFYTGRTHKLGEVHDGQAVMDWMKQEQERGITITAATTRVEWRGLELNLIDTPGHVDFTVEVERSLRVLDGAVVVLDAVSGVEPQTETIWRQADKYEVPRICFVNKMDRLGAEFDRSLVTLTEKLGGKPLPLALPLGAEAEFRGTLDLLSGDVLTWGEIDQGAALHRAPAAGADAEALRAGREKLLETLADYDDGVAEAFLEGLWPGEEVLRPILRRETLAGHLQPVLCGAALRNKGIQPLLDAVVDYLPSPLDVPPVQGIHPETGAAEVRHATVDEPFSALAFKVQQEQGRKLVYIRVYSGDYKSGRIYNATRKKLEKPAAVLRVHANKKETEGDAAAGDILAFSGLKWTVTGDTLCDADHPLLLETIAFAKPVISVAIEPRRSQDEAKLQEVLGQVQEEDPTFRVEVNEDTGQTLISGMGELHLEVLVRRIEEDYNCGVQVGKPQVVYKETIDGAGDGTAVFDRLLGDKRHRAGVTLRVEAAARGAGNRVDLAPTLPVLAPVFAAALRSGVTEAFLAGILSGNAVEDVAVLVKEIDFDETAPSEMAFKVAANQAFREACREAHPIQLEPIMRVVATVPDENLGEALGDLNARRGEVHGVHPGKGAAEVEALVPLRRMFGYSTDIRSLTQGRGTFTMSFARYDRSVG